MIVARLPLLFIIYSTIDWVSATSIESSGATKRIDDYNHECLKSSKVDPKLIEDAKNGLFSDDLKLKAHTLCFSKKAGLQDGDGTFQVEILKKRLLNQLNDEVKVQELIDKCVIVDKDPKVTAFNSLKCLQTNVRPGTLYV